MFPETGDSTEAAEGEAAHWALAEQLHGRLTDVGQIAPNGVVLTGEMCDGADRVSDYVARMLQPYGLRPSDGQIEATVQIPRVHPLSWGTPDYRVWLPTTPATLFVLDYKFGHRFVDEFENLQLVEYIAGITEGRHDMADGGVQIIAAIAQPRAFSPKGTIREWRTTLLDLRALINICGGAAHEALGPGPRARVGAECRDCRARHACPALQQAGYAAMDEAKHVTPLIMDAAAMSLELKLAKRAAALLQARIGGLEEQALATLKAGRSVPGWKVEHASGREVWAKPPGEVIAVAKMLGVDVQKRIDAITPKQALEAGLHPEVVKSLSKRTTGGASLVEDDGTNARRIFG